MDLLSTSRLSHEIEGRRILDTPPIDVKAKEHLLLLGPSGSGKTTLLNVLAGLLKPTSGSVTLNNLPFSALKPAQRDDVRRHNVGVVFQTLRLISAVTVRQNIDLAQKIALGRVDRVLADHLLQAVGLGNRVDAKPRFLSQGEAQRAAIARALSTRPKLLLADEPTSALDAGNAHSVIDLLLSAASDTGATLIVATHDERIQNRFPRHLNLAVAKDTP